MLPLFSGRISRFKVGEIMKGLHCNNIKIGRLLSIKKLSKDQICIVVIVEELWCN